MKYPLFYLALTLLAACSNEKQEGPVENVRATDTVNASETVPEKIIPQETKEVPENSFRTIYELESLTGNTYFDSLNHALFIDPNTKVETRKEICGGDYCQSVRSMYNGTTTLHFIKGDGGEYGFSNEGYVLENGRLVFAREFDTDIKEWPTDSTNTLWIVKERVFVFKPGKALVKERKTLTRKLYEIDPTLKNEAYITVANDSSTTLKAVTDRMKRLLEMENME